jgi:hypothetical protein
VGADSWYQGNVLGKRGLALQALARYDEAERDLLEAHRLIASELGEEHEQATRVAEYLVALYDTWDEAAPGMGHDERAEEWRSRLPAGSASGE